MKETIEKRTVDDTELYLAPEMPEATETEKAAIGHERKSPPKKNPRAVRVRELPAFGNKNIRRFRMSDGAVQDVISLAGQKTSDVEATVGGADFAEDASGLYFVSKKNGFVTRFSKDESNELFSMERDGHKITVLACDGAPRTKGAGRKLHVHRTENSRKADVVCFFGRGGDTEYEYKVNPTGIKENIVVKKKQKAYRYSFLLQCDNLLPILEEDGRCVVLSNPEDGRKIFRIPAPFMVDSDMQSSTDVHYELTSEPDGTTKLSIVANSEWMNDEKRLFPVIIDPCIEMAEGAATSFSWTEGCRVDEDTTTHLVGVSVTESDTTQWEENDTISADNTEHCCAVDLVYNRWTKGSISAVGESRWFKFVANNADALCNKCCGRYTLFTIGDVDTIGKLYDSELNIIGSNDDSFDRNFVLTADLIQGATYYLEVTAWGMGTGEFNVTYMASSRYCCEGKLSPDLTYTQNRMYMNLGTLDRRSILRRARIKNAELQVFQKNGTLTSTRPLLGLYHINEKLDENNLCDTTVNFPLLDCAEMRANYTNASDDTQIVSYTFDVTTLIDMLSANEAPYNNYMLKLINEQQRVDNVELYGIGSAYPPQLVVTYDSDYTMESDGSAHTHSIGRFGEATVDIKTGKLCLDFTDFEWSGNRLPLSVRHLYNSTLANLKYQSNPVYLLNAANFMHMNIGYGFMLNLMQGMHKPTTVITNGEEDIEYVYVDENGTETLFVKASDTAAIYKDAEEGTMTYNASERTLDLGTRILKFDAGERLIKICEGNNVQRFTYVDGKLTTATDGADRSFYFEYDENSMLTRITAPDGNFVAYEYNGFYLSCVHYPDGSRVSLSYRDGKPTVITLTDPNGTPVYKLNYAYNGHRVISVTEYGYKNGSFVKGTTCEYSYSMAEGRTKVVTKESVSNDAAEKNITTVYTFDKEGNVISDYVYTTDTGNVGGDGKESGINPHSGDGGVDIASNSNNLLKNHNFYDLADWWEMPDNCDELEIENIAYTSSPKYGNRQLRIASPNSSNRARGVYQDTVTLPIGKYTFSAYVRVYSVFNTANQPGIFLRVVDTEEKILGVSERIRLVDSEYVRLIVPFALNTAQSVRVQILANGVGAAYVNAPQLESNPYASPYNMMENGSFEYSLTSTTEDDGEDKQGVWRCDSWDGIALSNYTAFHLGKSLRIQGDLNNDRYLYQDLSVKSYYSTRETFTLSGWAKGYALPDHERFDVDDSPTFALRAAVVYHDGETEEFIANFAPRTGDWQFASVQISKSKRKALKYIRVFCEYGYNVGDAYFDNIQFTRDSIETELEASDFGDTSTEVATQEEDAPEKDTAPVFEEVKDEYGNTLTETTFADGDLGTIYRAFVFNVDNPECPGNDAGNNLVEETDARGYKTTYTVDGVTSRNEEVIDRLGNKTSYEYDDSGRTTKVTGKKADGTELANVSYTYDTFDNMTEIVRGDGMRYALAYNAFHNLESIGINGKAEKLIKYTYKNGNGRLKQMTYANGHTMKATYNAIGQMVAERWFETEAQAADPTATPVAHYKYVYDGDGNIARSIDILAGKEYTYEYEDGRIVRATESRVSINDDNVTSKTLLNTVRYCYDSEGKVTKKVVTPESGSAQTIYYETNDDNTVVKFSAGGRTVTSHSKIDSFGRKVFDELHLGTEAVSRQFVYHTGEATDTHKAKEKIKSIATTPLASQIILSNGTTYFYEYDAEERITSVVETYTENGTRVTDTTLYTYDALGQLLTEKVNGKLVNSMKYDNYGNIIEKNGKAYTYGNATWKDLLTEYNGQTIGYDAQGNPTTYLGHTLTWEKGRQLKKFVKSDGTVIDYTYNASGVRTSKKVNGVLHTYTLDGIKILRETWDGNTLIPLRDNQESICGILYNNIPYYFIKNLQGDVIAIVDKDAQTVARYSYDAWGKCTITEACIELTNGVDIATINPFRYRGYYYDKEIELYYLQSRYFDPEMGRFINTDEPDIITAVTTSDFHANLFAYCSNDPVDNVDRIGYVVSPANVIGAIIGGILGAVGGYFLSRWLADKLNLKGWKRTLFIAGITAVITAAAAVIGYFIGPYVQKVGQKIINALKNLIKTSCCFVAGTLIATSDGDKPIESICIGDYVLSKNEFTGEVAYKKVTNLFVRSVGQLVHIQASDADIQTTTEHPFWVHNRGWVPANELSVGDLLELCDNTGIAIDKIELKTSENLIPVYNFEVEDWHTYFITNMHILVHNKCDLTKISDSYLKRKGFDAHSLKAEFVGKANVSKYDLFYDKSSGAIFILKKGAKAAAAIATHYFIK